MQLKKDDVLYINSSMYFFCNLIFPSRILMKLWKDYSEQQEQPIQEPISLAEKLYNICSKILWTVYTYICV